MMWRRRRRRRRMQCPAAWYSEQYVNMKFMRY